MSDMENDDVQYDDTDLIKEQPTPTQVSQQKPAESTTSILERVLQEDSIPKEELRKRWNNKKSEREKMRKQWNKSKEQMKYWTSKTKELEHQLNRNAEELQRMKGRMLADVLSED